MSENVYDLGDKPRITNTFAINGSNADPDAAVLIVKRPDGSFQSFLSSAGFTDQGDWNANSNSPELAGGAGTVGHYYTVTVAGSVDFGDGLQTFAVGDYVAYDGESWLLIPSPQSATLTKSATGIYLYDLPVHQVGRYRLRFEGFGTVHAAVESSLQVRNSRIR